MTYWTRHHATSFAQADNPIHAGTTRKLLQDNLLSVYEQSGYDLDPGLGISDTVSFIAATTWAWVTTWQPMPIPVYRKKGGGWRTYGVEMKASSVALNVNTYFRVFLLDAPLVTTPGGSVVPGIDPATGLLAYTAPYVDLEFKSGALELKTGTVTPDRTCAPLGAADGFGVSVPLAYPCIAGKRLNVGAVPIMTLRVMEGA